MPGIIILVAIGLLSAGTSGAQTQVLINLKSKINSAVSDKEKLSFILELSEQAINPDSLLPYVGMAERIAAKTKNRADVDNAALCRAGYYIRKNITDSALIITEAQIARYKGDKQKDASYLKLIFFKAKIFDRANQFTKALTQLVEVIQTAETLKDTLIQIQAKTGIGWVQMEIEQYREALQWLYKAMYTSADKKFYKNYGALYSNIANAYNAMGNADSARYYINIAIKDARENNNMTFLATALSMQAKILIDNKQPNLAEAPLNEALSIRKVLNDPFYTVYDMSSLARYYANNNQAEKGIELCKQGIALAKQSGLSSQLMMMYHALADNYKAAGKTVEYGETLEHVLAIKDSFNTINSAKLIADMEASNEAQKQEKQIMEQKLKLTQKNYWIYGSAIFGLMAAVITWLAFENYRRKQDLKMQLAVEEEKRIASKAVADAEEQERKRIAADLHDNLGAYAASIVSNIDHIKILPADPGTVTAMQELRNNSREIVSQLNDTIWVMKKDALSLTAISDRLKIFIQRIQSSYPNIKIDVMENISDDHLLPPSQAFHLFQILQEAINNAVRHSGGNEVIVSIQSNTAWKITISDNGKGFDSSMIKEGNGLMNMKARSKEAGWTIECKTNVPEGTQLIITPTTN